MVLGPIRQPPHLAVKGCADEAPRPQPALTHQVLQEYQTSIANNTSPEVTSAGPSSHVMFTQRMTTMPKLALFGCPAVTAQARKLSPLFESAGQAPAKSSDRCCAVDTSTRPPRRPIARSVEQPLAVNAQSCSNKRTEHSNVSAGGSHIMKIACREVPSRGYERFSDTPIVAAAEECRQLPPLIHRHNTSPLLSRINTPNNCGLPTFAPSKRTTQFDDGVTLKRVTSSPMMGVEILGCSENNFVTDSDCVEGTAIPSSSLEPGMPRTAELDNSGQSVTVIKPKATRKDGASSHCLPRTVSPVRKAVTPVVHGMSEAVSFLSPSPTGGIVLPPPAGMPIKNVRGQTDDTVLLRDTGRVDDELAENSNFPAPSPSPELRCAIWAESAFCRRPKSPTRSSHVLPVLDRGARAKESKRESKRRELDNRVLLGIGDGAAFSLLPSSPGGAPKQQRISSPTGLGENFKSAERLIEWAETSAWRQLRIAQKGHY